MFPGTLLHMKTPAIKEAVVEGRVKRHVFLPSGRTVWTVVGRKAEYWVDPHHGYCSCPAHYFGGPAGTCYHIKYQIRAHSSSTYETIEFHDEEFDAFVTGLVNDVLVPK